MAFTKFTYVRSLLAAKIHGERRLLSLSLCVTNRCNIACLYCYGDYYFRQGKNPEVDDLLKVIDDACALGLQHLYLTGGEPLIRPDIGAIVERAADHGLRTGMVTNGYFLPRQVKNLKRLDKVVLSLDGREGPNDAKPRQVVLCESSARDRMLSDPRARVRPQDGAQPQQRGRAAVDAGPRGAPRGEARSGARIRAGLRGPAHAARSSDAEQGRA